LAESLEKIERRTSLCMILTLGQSWMVMCTILSGAMCLADILIITLPNTLAHVMEKAVAAISFIHLIKDAGPCGFWHRPRRAQSQTELIISATLL
jgi:hypothetical protein